MIFNKIPELNELFHVVHKSDSTDEVNSVESVKKEARNSFLRWPVSATRKIIYIYVVINL